jgi:serine/threonine protein kinase
MSPEQVQCFPVDQRSDIYSLGLVVYEMLTGRRPFEGNDQWKVMEMRTDRDIPDPAELIPDMPGPLRDFIRKACTRDPDKRFRNIAEVLASMKSLAAEYGLTNGGPHEPKRKIRMFYLVYGDEDTKELKAAVDDFNIKMKRIGVELKAGDLIDLQV